MHILIVGLVCGCGSAWASDISYYKDVPTFRMDTKECDSEDVGSVQVSCKYIEIGTIDGYLSVADRRDPRWPSLEKYWNNTQNWLKFAGIACARDPIEAEATRTAMSRAQNLVSRLTADWDEETFTGSLKSAGYRKDDYGFKCVTVPNNAEQTVDAPESTPDDQVASDTETPPPSPPSNVATFVVTNNDRYTVGLEFTSQSRRDAVWPGDNRQYTLAGEQTYNLNCQPGEKICYGAWRENQRVTWGTGRNNRESCEHCCVTCGGRLEVSLSDGGADVPLQDPNVATFILHNKDRYRLGVEFTSQNRSAAWPGGNQQYNLSGDGTYNLTCQRGEKICFGAWRDYQSTVWGVGRNNKESCQHCCTQCGSSFETTLTDGGADSPLSNGNSLANILNSATAIINGLNSLQNSQSGGGGATYTPRNGREQRQGSDISGTTQ
jgi:hypothetical protein